jgi:hypothetical protein
MRHLKIKKKEFQFLLKSLAKLSDSSILTLSSDGINAISSSEDNSMYLWGCLDGDFEDNTLNLPSLRKLSTALDLISDDDITLIINNNNLEYKNKNIKFVYHLYDDGILTRPKLSLEKIRSFKYDVEFEFDMKFLSSILKHSSITSTNKIYIYTDNGHLIWSLADKTIVNSDSLSIIGSKVSFNLPPIIINIDNMKNISKTSSNSAIFRVNSKLGVGNIDIESNDLHLNYIISSLVK